MTNTHIETFRYGFFQTDNDTYINPFSSFYLEPNQSIMLLIDYREYRSQIGESVILVGPSSAGHLVIENEHGMFSWSNRGDCDLIAVSLWRAWENGKQRSITIRPSDKPFNPPKGSGIL